MMLAYTYSGLEAEDSFWTEDKQQYHWVDQEEGEGKEQLTSVCQSCLYGSNTGWQEACKQHNHGL